MRKKALWIGGSAVVVAGAVVAALAMRGRGDETLQVQTASVSRQKIVQKVSGTGKIQPKTQVKISADVSARINRRPRVSSSCV